MQESHVDRGDTQRAAVVYRDIAVSSNTVILFMKFFKLYIALMHLCSRGLHK